MAGLEPVVVFWTEWGLHFVVLLSFTVQVTLLLLADLRRRNDWAVLKVIIWSAYMLADTTAIYALGHMSVVFRWSPEHNSHQLMALWAPLLLVHLGGQDNISAYAIEDNRLWLRHLQTFVLQVAAAGYVLYMSSILSHPLSKVSLAAILMFVVGLLKYGERIWALKCSNSCASSSLSVTSYDKVRTTADESKLIRMLSNGRNRHLIQALLQLDTLKQMFEGPTSFVQISNNWVPHNSADILRVVEVQMSMMYDLLYTKAAVVHTWYGLCSRGLISLPFTVTALALFCSTSMSHGGDRDDTTDVRLDYYSYTRADVVVTNVLLVGAVVLETMSLVRAIFSKWTAILLYRRGWNTIGNMVFLVIDEVTRAMERLVRSAAHNLHKLGRRHTCNLEARRMERDPLWLGRMRQHNIFVLMGHHYNYSVGRKMAKRMRVEDWWDSNVYSWGSAEVPVAAIGTVVKLVNKNKDNITKSQGLNAVQRYMHEDEQLADWIWTKEELKLEERILVWHIATHVYIMYYKKGVNHSRETKEASMGLANYMFFLLAARPYMLPYPVSRQAYVQLCHDALTYFPRDFNIKTLVDAILKQKEALVNGTPLQLERDDEGIGQRQRISMNTTTLDRACQLAAKLIHISTVNGEQAETTFSFDGELIVNMILEVWTEMLCYTAYRCNENYHAKHLTDGGEFMTFIALLMIYVRDQPV